MVEKLYSWVNRFLENLMALLMVFIVILMFTEVVCRYFFRAPIVWCEEMATYAFIWIIYLGSGVAFYRNAHIRVDYISYRMSKETLRWIDVVLNLLMAFFFVFLLLYGMKFASMNFRADSYTFPVIKLGWIYLAVPVGGAMMFCNVARNLYLVCWRKEMQGSSQENLL